MNSNKLETVLEIYVDGRVSTTRDNQPYEFDDTRRPNGYWTLENTLTECRQVIETEEGLPTQQRMRALGQSRLAAAITKLGGMHEIRKQLGLEDQAPERPKGYWTEERVIEIYRELTEELGKPPSSKKLAELGYAGMSWNISHKFGGFANIQGKIGVKSGKSPNGYWSTEKTLEACSDLIDEHGDLPNQILLLEISTKHPQYRGISTAVRFCVVFTKLFS